MVRNTVGAALIFLSACFNDLGGSTGATSAGPPTTSEATSTGTSSTTGSSSGVTEGGSCTPPDSAIQCTLCCAADTPESSVFFANLTECLCTDPADPCRAACDATLCEEKPMDQACYACIVDLQGCASAAMLACEDDDECEDFFDCTGYFLKCASYD